MTAGHCICHIFYNEVLHPGAYCKTIDQNQVSIFNEITLYGGDMDREKLIYRKNLRKLEKGFKIKKAIIYDTPKEDWADMGILFTKKLLFNHKKLLKLSGERKPLILPICLPSKDLNLADKSMHGVGWGLIYHESPVRDQRNPNPVYSSCMTNEIGNKDWRFQACNMVKIKNNNWSCEKKELPPMNVRMSRIERIAYWYECQKLFGQARKFFQQSDRSKIDFMNKVDKIIVSHEDDPSKKTVCYSEKLLKEKGWCEVHHADLNTNPNAWGFCSPSCNPDYLQVLGSVTINGS